MNFELRLVQVRPQQLVNSRSAARIEIATKDHRPALHRVTEPLRKRSGLHPPFETAQSQMSVKHLAFSFRAIDLHPDRASWFKRSFRARELSLPHDLHRKTGQNGIAVFFAFSLDGRMKFELH